MTPAAAAAAGSRGLTWLRQKVREALDRGNREDARRWADAIVGADPDDVPALLTIDLRGEDPRRLRRSGLDIASVAQGWPMPAAQTLVRLDRALAQEPGATRLAVARAGGTSRQTWPATRSARRAASAPMPPPRARRGKRRR